MIHKLDSHTHTLASGHAYNTIMEMAKAAVDQKLELLAVTDHAMAMPGTCHSFYFMNLRSLPRSMYGIEVLFGSEVNIMNYDGKLDMSQGLLEQMDVNIIGHPDDARYPVDFELVVPAAKEHHVLLELNNSSLKPDSSRKEPLPNDIRMLELCKKYKAQIIVDSDAHNVWEVGGHDYAYELLKAMDFPEELVVNRSVEEYKTYTNRFKKI